MKQRHSTRQPGTGRHTGAGSRRGPRGAPGVAERRQVLEHALECGLQDTFPASDPVSVIQPPSNPRDKDQI